jgi:pterin-4a-carbinolamine dehydratase
MPPLTRKEAELFQPQTPDRRLSEEAHRIDRSFRFRDSREALTFVQEIGELAEAEGPSSGYLLRLGQCDGLSANQEDQGTA